MAVAVRPRKLAGYEFYRQVRSCTGPSTCRTARLCDIWLLPPPPPPVPVPRTEWSSNTTHVLSTSNRFNLGTMCRYRALGNRSHTRRYGRCLASPPAACCGYCHCSTQP